jgi:hypothetical protein
MRFFFFVTRVAEAANFDAWKASRWFRTAAAALNRPIDGISLSAVKASPPSSFEDGLKFCAREQQYAHRQRRCR